MIFHEPRCPSCGKPASGLVEEVIASVEEVTRGRFEYSGVTDLTTQTTAVDNRGFVTLVCDDGHDWKTKMTKRRRPLITRRG